MHTSTIRLFAAVGFLVACFDAAACSGGPDATTSPRTASPSATAPAAASPPWSPPSAGHIKNLGIADAGAAETCSATGTFCGGQGVEGGDPNTLYVCSGGGAAPVSSMTCLEGCVPGSGGAAECSSAPATGDGGATPSIACPATGGYYCGGDVISGDPGTLYHCPSGSAGQAPDSAQSCASGCQVEPQGTNDLCKGTIVCAGVGDFCGGDSLSGDTNTLYHCPGAGEAPGSSQSCANGCSVQPANVPDLCSGTLKCPGLGDYCGSDGVQGGDANMLYHCPGSGQAPSGSSACGSGCTVEPAGTPDFCAATSKCSGAGDYCGSDGLNGPANVLYHCAGTGQDPGSPQICNSGCQTEPAGTNDFCAGSAGNGSCSATGQAALNWEANRLNTGHAWSDYCLGFVNSAFGGCPAYCRPTAAAALAAAQASGHFVPWNGSCPCGAILYWGGNNCNAEDGHVVICNGDGTVSTSGWPGFNGSTNASISWLDGMECGHTPAGYIQP